MKKMLSTLFLLLFALSLVTGCARPQNPPQPSASPTAPEISQTTGSEPAPSTEPTVPATLQTEPQAPTEEQDPDYYAVCTGCSKQEVEQFAREVRDLVLSENWAELSGYIAYPITLGDVTCEDSAAFAAAPFEELLDADAIAALRDEDCTDLFCNWTGIMLGNGEVWIGELLNEDFSSAGLRVIALNIFKTA